MYMHLMNTQISLSKTDIPQMQQKRIYRTFFCIFQNFTCIRQLKKNILSREVSIRGDIEICFIYCMFTYAKTVVYMSTCLFLRKNKCVLILLTFFFRNFRNKVIIIIKRKKVFSLFNFVNKQTFPHAFSLMLFLLVTFPANMSRYTRT